MKIRNASSLVIILIVLMSTTSCSNNTKSDINEGNKTISNQEQYDFNVDEFLQKLLSPEYSETNIPEVLLIRNYKDYIKIIEVKDNKIFMEINFDDGILNISGKFNVINGNNDYSMINQDGYYIDSDYNEVKYIVNENPSEESIRKSIMNYADNKMFNTFNIDDFIFIPSIGENEVSIKSINSSKDANVKRIIDTKFTYTHKDKYFNVDGEISMFIKEVDEISPPKIEINENNSKSLGTTAPTKEEVFDKIHEGLMVTGISFKTLTKQEIDSINILNVEMKAKLGMSKGVVVASYLDSDDNTEKNIEIPFKIVKKDRQYEIQVDTTATYAN